MNNNSSAFGKKSIIVADDDAQIRSLLKKTLRYSEYEVIDEASNGLELYNKCKALNPDIAIVDIHMPTIDGISAAKMIADEGKAKCIIILTSYDDKEFINRAIDVGVSGYMTKPLDGGMLIPTLENSLVSSKQLYERKKELDKVIKKKKSLKYIDKAKLYLMERNKISEDEAYLMMKDLSKRKKIPLESVARIIISKLEKENA